MRLRRPLVALLAGALVAWPGTAGATEPTAGLTAPRAFAPPPGPTFVPADLAADGQGRVFVLSADGSRVVVYSTAGRPIDDWPTGLPAASNRLEPRVAVAPSGTVYVATREEAAIRAFSAAGAPLGVYADPADPDRGLPSDPRAIAATPRGELLLRSSGGEYRLQDGRFRLLRRGAYADRFAVARDGTRFALSPTGLLGTTPGGAWIWIQSVGGGRVMPGWISDGSDLAVSAGGGLLTFGGGVLSEFGPRGQLRRFCPTGVGQSASAGVAVASDGTVVGADATGVYGFDRARRGEICSRQAFRLTRVAVRRARGTRRSVRVRIRVTVTRGRPDPEGYRLTATVVRERAEACLDGRPARSGRCAGVAGFDTPPLGVVRAGRTTQETLRLPEAGRYRIILGARSRSTGVAVSKFGVQVDVP
ncbi:MAG TPA: hypothetical protein VF533_22850 [Solirubrobacteraceae bacterium]|jgi:hypothetical protein